MKQLFTSVLTLSALFFCFTISATVATSSEVGFKLTISVSEALDSKITFISEDEEDFITRTLSGTQGEIEVQLRTGVNYALTLSTSSFIPMMQEFVISEEHTSQNFMHLDLEHLTDGSGNVVGEQILIIVPTAENKVFPSLSTKTQKMLKLVQAYSKSEKLNTYSKTKFYMTAEEYRMKLKEEGKPLAKFDENSEVKYLITADAEVMMNDSYHELIPSGKKGLLVVSFSDAVQQDTESTASSMTTTKSSVTTTISEIERTDKLFFSVQLGVFSNEVKNPQGYFKTSSIITEGADSGQYKYFSGVFYSYAEANAHKENLMGSGQEGAFVVAFNNGKPLPLEEAINAIKSSAESE